MITHQVSTSGYGVEEITPERVAEFMSTFEAELAKAPQYEFTVEHEFADGIYSRRLFIPAGATIMGLVHKQNDLNIMVYGDIDVLTANGMRRIEGHEVFPGEAGIKQFGHAYKDTLWITVHHTHLTDLHEIEEALFEEGIAAFDFITGKVKPEVLQCQG
jgi:hypothetical protein